jgi:phospholipase C
MMATQQTAEVYIANGTDGTATVTLYHHNSTNGTQHGTWTVRPGERAGPLRVLFKTGYDVAWVKDWWAVTIRVRGGSKPGVYQSAGFASLSDWKECQLRAEDAGKTLDFGVDASTFRISVPSGTEQAPMSYVGPYATISHVFVLMLENHSFDNMFAFSGIDGITAATTNDSNTHGGNAYHVSSPATVSMPTDPGHGFLDVVEQLCGLGQKKRWQEGQAYPAITNSGYVSNYATSEMQIVKPGAPRQPTPAEYGDVMKCFDTPRQLPVIYQLATEFALCDQWFSSLPGPTWPNRFFVHGASSVNWDDSPSSEQMVSWQASGFTYPHGSIYEALEKQKIGYRLYADHSGDILGSFPQVAALRGISLPRIRSFEDLKDDLQGPYPYVYTFIEPNYGDTVGGSYTGGSSQHPMDGVAGGEALIKATYEALRASPLWATSLLIITYDEHGGFYDSAIPGGAVPPSDGGPVPENQHGFRFDQYGPRVPAIVVSPLIPRGVVDHTVYDHTSILATVERLFDVPPLTQRDKHANDLRGLLSLDSPRPDCPTTIAAPVSEPAPPPSTDAAPPAGPVEHTALPDEGNIHGFLAIMLKTDIELAHGDAADIQAMQERVRGITTRVQAEAYAHEVYAKVQAAKLGLADPPPVGTEPA